MTDGSSSAVNARERTRCPGARSERTACDSNTRPTLPDRFSRNEEVDRAAPPATLRQLLVVSGGCPDKLNRAWRRVREKDLQNPEPTRGLEPRTPSLRIVIGGFGRVRQGSEARVF